MTLFYVYKLFPCVDVYAPYVCLVPVRLEKASDPLELRLLMVVNHHEDARNQTLLFWKSNKCS